MATPQAKGVPNGCPQKLLRDTQKRARTASSAFRGIAKSNTLRYGSWLRAQIPGAGAAFEVVRPVSCGGRLPTPVPDRPPLCISCQDRLPMGAPARPEAFSTRERQKAALSVRGVPERVRGGQVDPGRVHLYFVSLCASNEREKEPAVSFHEGGPGVYRYILVVGLEHAQ